MNVSPPDRDAIERIRLLQPVQDWAAFRDTEQWDRLRAVYAPGATTAVSWFDGDANEFVSRCQQMAAGGEVAAHHAIGTSQCDRCGDRALVSSRVTILMRLAVHGVLCDVTAVSRFIDRVVRHSDDWLITARVAVFEKDGIQPVYPGDRLELDRSKLLIPIRPATGSAPMHWSRVAARPISRYPRRAAPPWRPWTAPRACGSPPGPPSRNADRS